VVIENRTHRDYVEYVYPIAEHKKFLKERKVAEATHGARVMAYNGQQDTESWLRLYHYLCEVPGYKQPTLEERNTPCKCCHPKGLHIGACTAPGCPCTKFEEENWE
jgi:hypothetical protein